LRDRTYRFMADWARYDAEKDEIWARGNVSIKRLSDTVSGPELRLNRVTSTGFINDAKYEFGPSPTRPTQFYAHGTADKVVLAGPDRYEATNATTRAAVAEGTGHRTRRWAQHRRRLPGRAHHVRRDRLPQPRPESGCRPWPLRAAARMTLPYYQHR
jgi:hypothetical protein